MKIKLLLLIFFTIFINVNAQLSFDKHTIIGLSLSVEKPVSTHPADFDGDGDMDIIIMSKGFSGNGTIGAKLAWYENLDGKGVFGDANPIVYQSLENIYLLDMDGDGDLDILSTLYDCAKWLENIDTKGTFSTSHPILDDIESLLPEDVDGDGDFDIVCLFNRRIAWIENIDINGGFNNSCDRYPYKLNYISDYDDYSYLLPIDMDGDGDIDVRTTLYNPDRTTVWYENTDGNGLFDSLPIQITSIKKIAPKYNIDLNNDGYLDIISTRGTNQFSWLKSINGNDDFEAEQIILDNMQLSRLSSINFNDINGDGYIDIIIDSYGKVEWFEHLDGNGAFSSKKTIHTYASIFGDKSVSLADLDGDSDLDIIISSYDYISEVFWYENKDGLGDFQFVEKINGDVPAYSSSILTADIDGDSDMDIISSGKWYENKNGIGNYSKFGNDIGGISSSILEIIDMDSDGDNDLLLEYEWIENDGRGNFNSEEKHIITSLRDGNTKLFYSDIDSDGIKDVVASKEKNSSEVYLVWYKNLGNYMFEPPKSISTDSYTFAYSTLSGDIDNDGDNDILITHYKGSNDLMGWFENLDGKGNFGSLKTIIGAGDARGISLIDLDNDGDLDLLYTLYYIYAKVVWRENLDGKGTFGTSQDISGNFNNSLRSYPVDMDKDGLIDIVYGSSSSPSVYWEKNIGNVQYQNRFQYQDRVTTSSIPGNVRSIYIADLDGDQDDDIIVNSDKFELTWYENSLYEPIEHNKISGKVNLDLNSNGCDINDLSMPRLKIVSNNIATFTQKDGSYELFTDIGDYTTSITSNLPNYYSPNPITKTSSFSNVGNNEIINFCVEPTQTINDVNIVLLPTSQARPGFDSSYQLVFHNVGTTQLNGSVLLEFNDSKLTFLTASKTVSSQTNNSITFDYSNLNPFETRTIDLDFNVIAPPTTNIGDFLSFITTIDPVSGDNTENDNVFELNQTVIGSYDPNDILVLEGSEILLEDANEYLHYIIRFQNTGTADAVNVRVENILDPNLDWNTIQIESSSHTNRVEIKDDNEVSFIFNGIYLPDSTTDEPNSHGFMAYKIKPKSGIAIGDIMQNKADIFFDFNLPIITNTVSTEIASVLSLNKNELSDFQIYPNPTTGIFNIKSKSRISEIQIYNNLGQIVVYQLDKNTIDVSLLNTGLYFIKIKDEIGNSKIKKFIKE